MPKVGSMFEELPLHALHLRNQCLIDGCWTGGSDLPVYNPATGAIIGHVPDFGLAEAKAAIAAADAALPEWSARTAAERSAILRAWHDLVLQDAAELADLLSSEQGKPIKEARGEIEYAAAFLAWFAEEGKRVYGEVIPSPRADTRLVVLKQPVGVVAAITPWNFPAAMVTRKLAPALAAGCTAVLKPAPQTPLTALALVGLAKDAGVPRGVVNVVTGDAIAIGHALTASPTVRKLSFTGSTAVGKLLAAQCAPTLKRVSLELGGNAPFIIFGDADVDHAVDCAIAAKFRNAGQTCVCVNRFLVHRTVAAEFEQKLALRLSQMVVGPGDNSGTDIGPLIDRRAVDKVDRHVADALANGGRLLAGGKAHPMGGNFYEPTLVADCSAAMLVAKEETFGPFAAIFVFDDDAEAIRLANDTRSGLAAYFMTRDVVKAWRIAEAIEAGMVGVNTGIISTEVAPFGGVKESGTGREGSRHGIDEYLDIKLVAFGGLKE